MTRERILVAMSGGVDSSVATARLLGMSRAALYERLARWPELGGRG